MTDRLKGVYVAFENDIRIDSAEIIINAIKMIKGVSAVKGDITDPSDWINRQHIKQEIKDKIFKLYDSL